LWFDRFRLRDETVDFLNRPFLLPDGLADSLNRLSDLTDGLAGSPEGLPDLAGRLFRLAIGLFLLAVRSVAFNKNSLIFAEKSSILQFGDVLMWSAATGHRFPTARHVSPFPSADMSTHSIQERCPDFCELESWADMMYVYYLGWHHVP
jgi:hypothetical protein